MIITDLKREQLPKVMYKQKSNDLYTLYKVFNSRTFKRFNTNSIAYQNFAEFHNLEIIPYFADLEKYVDNDCINIPHELFVYLSYIKGILQRQSTCMYIDQLLPKTKVEELLSSIEQFYERVRKLDELDFSFVKSEDIIFTGNILQIYNPEFIRFKRVSEKDNIKAINGILINGLFKSDIREFYPVEELMDYVLNGEETVYSLFKEIVKLESKKNGKVKYLKHISGTSYGNN